MSQQKVSRNLAQVKRALLPLFSLFVLKFVGYRYLIPKVQNCKKRIINYHPRSSKAHYLTHLLSNVRLITMNRAFGTRRFIDLVRALVNTLLCISEQLLAFFTQAFHRMMMFPAKNLNHFLNSVSFPI